MNTPKRILFWTVCYILSFVSLIIAFPVLLFTFYPYSIIAIAIYTIVVIILSISSFTTKRIALKPILFVSLLIPIVTLITVLVSIETGWLHFPG